MSVIIYAIFQFLLLITSSIASPTTIKYNDNALQIELTTAASMPSVLRCLVGSISPYLRNVEDIYLHCIRELEQDIRNVTRTLEDVISPAHTITDSDAIDPIPKIEADKIQTAARLLQDNMWSVKTFEPTILANVRAIQNSVRDLARNIEDKYQQNKHSVEFVLTASRGYLDVVRRTVRFLDDKVKENIRYLEDNAWKFIRTLEDVVQIIEKSPTVYWKNGKERQFSKILYVIYNLKRNLKSNTSYFGKNFNEQTTKIEEIAGYGVDFLLLPVTNRTYVTSDEVRAICPTMITR